jgi:alpha-beta hydrolase superfamily lysophospholipase
MSSAAAELVARARAGRRLDFGGVAPERETAELMLEPQTEVVREVCARAGAAEVDLDGALERLEHEWVAHRGVLLHLEHHGVESGAPTFVIVHGLGDHSRRQLGLAAALADRGFNSLLVDRHGHGLSEGRRGDSPLEADLGLLELAVSVARARNAGPVILLGDSLGGILCWYLLTREPDVDAAICHCIGHPDVHHDPSFKRKAPLLRALARVAPFAPIPVRQIADYEHVALHPHTRRYFDEELDPLFNFTVSARSVASFVGFRPGIAWERVSAPALVLIGADDRMVTPEFTRRALAAGRPPRSSLAEIPGAGHQLFLDDLAATIGPLTEWVETAVEQRPLAA